MTTIRRPAPPVEVDIAPTEPHPTPGTGPAARSIRVRGAREHNLKNVSVDIPRDRLVVITGLSGSGKSSLAFDTIFAEGQRKYMESLSAYARQFLDQLKKPDVEEIEGIPPTIAIEQRSASSNPRSTVATTTEIYDYLRLLFARCGKPFSWAPVETRKDGVVARRAGTPISATSSSQIVDAVMGMAQGSRIMVLAPVVRAKKGFHRDVLEDLSAKGWTRARVNGALIDLRDALKEPGENPLKLGRYHKHSIDAVIDRLALAPDSRQRLAESIEQALRLADGSVVVSVETGADPAWSDRAFSDKFADPERPEYALEEVSPRLFSFNSPFGACPTCHGLGTLVEMDEALAIDDSLSLADGAVRAWAKNGPVRAWFNRHLRKFCKGFGADFHRPVKSLTKDQRRILVHGATPDDQARFGAKFEGVLPNVTNWWQSTENESVKEFLSQFLSQKECTACLGDRLRIEALHVLVESGHRADSAAFSRNAIGRPRDDGTWLNIAEFSRLTITDAAAFINALRLSREQTTIAEPILKEINNRLRFLMGVGLEYLSLNRRTATLSGGEAQRIRLATQVGSGLVGACYVLDEPTIGLHQRDNSRLIATLRHLTDIGNTVLVVEHDEEMIRAADHILDIGPGPGVHGGSVVAQGSVAQICANPGSITGQYLSGKRSIPTPAARRPVGEKKSVVVKDARANNLKSVDVAFPVGGLVCVTGVSGSGKSTLVNDILLQAALRHMGYKASPAAHTRVAGLTHFSRVIEVDQSPIGRTPRSNPATYTGIFGEIRDVFAKTKEAKIRGYKPGRFSFNVKGASGGGRCEACQGQGLKKIEMHFLPDVYIECELCRGKRYNRETLEVHYRSRTIADVLDTTIEDACAFFENHPRILRMVECLRDVGLGYIKLGQPSTQLSGGEAQRIKLATELGKGPSAGADLNRDRDDDDEADGPAPPAPPKKGLAARLAASSGSGSTLYILDEPTTGLHFEDVRKLVDVFNRLADAGNTLVVIEHNLDVIKCADWIIDLGPEGGEAGGRVVAAGAPEHVARVEGSHTGRYLRQVLGA
jgi:excinuclease ABC subunit A